MPKLVAVAAIVFLATGCAPPRWSQPLCRGQPETRLLPPEEKAAFIRKMTDDQLLDVAACNTVTSEPSNAGIPDELIAERARSIAKPLVTRLSKEDPNLVAMTYLDLLQVALNAEPRALTPAQRKIALASCRQNYSDCEAFQ